MGLHTVAELMAISARTAPKSAGQDFVVTKIIEGQDLQRLGEAMIKFGDRTGKSNFDRDGNNVLDSQAVVLIGLKDARDQVRHHDETAVAFARGSAAPDRDRLHRDLRACRDGRGHQLIFPGNRQLSAAGADLALVRKRLGQAGVLTRPDRKP